MALEITWAEHDRGPLGCVTWNGHRNLSEDSRTRGELSDCCVVVWVFAWCLSLIVDVSIGWLGRCVLFGFSWLSCVLFGLGCLSLWYLFCRSDLRPVCRLVLPTTLFIILFSRLICYRSVLQFLSLCLVLHLYVQSLSSPSSPQTSYITVRKFQQGEKTGIILW